MSSVTLAKRLLLATGLLSAAATAALGYGVREAWRRAEEQRFESEFQPAVELLTTELAREFTNLPVSLGSHCAHDSLVDQAQIGLTSGDLESRRLSISLRVPELAKALEVEELWLVTPRGEVLGAHATSLVGQRDPKLAARVVELGDQARLTPGPGHRIEAACRRKDPQNPKLWVGLLARRDVDAVLARLGKAYAMTLSLEPVREAPGALTRRFELAGLPGVSVTASRSRLPLTTALSRLDSTVLLIGGLTMLAALAAAGLLSRGLARPFVELAREASAAMQGEPRPILARGPREIEEAAAAFNRAIQDLLALRGRLAATERIAAWREIARSVAHEIKNPLAPIRAAIETLRRLRARQDPAFDDYFDEATRTALAEVNRINQIVSEFTEFARLPPPSPTEVDIVQLARDVVGLHATGGAAVTLDERACPKVRADQNQIVQVVTNLVQNALDAVSGRPAPEVVVRVAPVEGERVRVSVHDNGPGIAAEMRERLFLPYATTKPHGTGLGLAIAQRLVVEHGGEIGCRDGAHGGTEFWFELPVSGPNPASPPAEGAQPAQKAGTAREVA
ncbi:MAG TPA: ATP-binding protein [Polyangiaceae bacterium]|nr:ATP-binding protein [Polyangiaceae bacterium]